jgi:hypothetical protein
MQYISRDCGFTPWSLLCTQIRYPSGIKTVVLEPWGPAVTFR